MWETIGVANADNLVPIEDDQKPVDPVSENMAFLTGKPTKAFIYQDHQAHMEVHLNAMQDPMIAQVLAQNPQGANFFAATLQAHVAQHLSFLYRAKLEEQLGVPLPPPDEELPEEIETQLSRLTAEASKKLLQQNQAIAQQEVAQQAMQDPVVQMQQQELQLKAREQERKEVKDQQDGVLKQQELELDAERIRSQEKQKLAEILAKAAAEDEALNVKQIIEGAKLGFQASQNKDAGPS